VFSAIYSNEIRFRADWNFGRQYGIRATKRVTIGKVLLNFIGPPVSRSLTNDGYVSDGYPGKRSAGVYPEIAVFNVRGFSKRPLNYNGPDRGVHDPSFYLFARSRAIIYETDTGINRRGYVSACRSPEHAKRVHVRRCETATPSYTDSLAPLYYYRTERG